MKASELRIGNYLSQSITGIVFQVGLEYFEKLYIGVYFLENVDPIPLTEVWLTNFGFTYPDPHYLIWYKEGFGPFRVLFDIHLKHWQIGYSGGRVFKKIEYVHQLQNLYFALTEEELTIK